MQTQTIKKKRTWTGWAFGGPAWEIANPIANCPDIAPVHIISSNSAVAAEPYATAQYIITPIPSSPIIKRPVRRLLLVDILTPNLRRSRFGNPAARWRAPRRFADLDGGC
jgi:hypothetical protein